MNNDTNNNARRTADRWYKDQEIPNDDRSKRTNENGTIAAERVETTAGAAKSTPAAARAEAMDDTSSSTSEEVMSGAQSDQTANISSNGGYSGDYESISDSSSGASKKRKPRNDAANAIGGENVRRRRVKDDENEEKTEHVMEDGGSALSLSRPSSLAHMNAAESEGGAMPVDFGRHHHHHHHHQVEVDELHNAAGNNNNSHHHHHYHHHTYRPNKATSRQVNRQIDQIMNLYNVSLQAQAHSQAAMRGDTANGSNETQNKAAANAGDADDSEIRTQRSRVHYPYQVESKGSLSGDQSQSPRGSSNGHNSRPSKEVRCSVQLGGVRIVDPSDPRIDIAKLYQPQNAASGYGRPKEDSDRAETNQQDNDKTGDHQCASKHDVEHCYTNLMEACRPFFQDTETIMASKKIPLFRTATANQSQVASDEAQSSSGFTSFFTTTKSESNTNGCGSGGSSQSEFSHQNKKRKIEEQEEKEDSNDGASLLQKENATYPNDHLGHVARHEQQEPQSQRATLARTPSYSYSHLEVYQSDSSSMVVLARVKRKHKDQRRRFENCSPVSINTAKAVCAVSSSTIVPTAAAAAAAQDDRKGMGAEEFVSKRVRIEAVALDAAKYRSPRPLQPSINKQPESSSLASSLSTSVDSSGSDGGGGAQTKRNDGAHTTTGTSGEDRSKADSQSGSGENSNNQAARTVTDTSGTTTANNSSGSGTGSGNDNDATNKSESGSQMEGISNSDDKACAYYKKDSVASDTNTVTSVAAVNGDVKNRTESLQETDKPMIHHHNHSGKKSAVLDVNGHQKECERILDDSQQPQSNNNVITKEEKLMEKKRKRMSARKEYEEEWQRQIRDSSESSSKNDTTTLEPGKPVTLEDVLSFTKTARLLVQALPPFLAVHANAAFTQLTGINSHIVIGQPVASIIAIAEGLPPNKESDSSGSDNTNNKDAMSSLSGSLEGNEGPNPVNVVNANDPRRQDQQEPPSDGNVAINAHETSVSAGFRIDRLIVARGYGHIHNVEVIFAPPQVTAHAIEGSEVKISDGNANAKRKKKDDKIFCRMSVSPVVTSIESWDSGRIEGQSDSKIHPHSSSSVGKRRKHGHVENEFMIVKHYLIQLESMDGPHLLGKRSSFSSSTDTTVEAQLLGITRSELVARRCRLERGQRDAPEVVPRPSSDGGIVPETDSQDENSSAVEPVATCG